MIEFWQAVGQFAFLQNALVAAVAASISGGLVGTLVVTRRITYLAGAVAHAVLGGLGAAHYLKVVVGWEWLHPMYGAVAASVLAAAVVAWVSQRAREREDATIGAVWAIGMAAGILFIAGTPGYNRELMSFLFGNILMVSPSDLYLVIALDAIVLAVTWLLWRRLVAVSFDGQFARTRGVNVDLVYLTLLVLTALTVVVLVMLVGVVLVIAVLSIPAAIAGRFTSTLGRMALASTAICILTSFLGIGLSYHWNLPAGATIILVMAAAYVVVWGGSYARKSRKSLPSASSKLSKAVVKPQKR